ncbi:MAG: 16S rRNA (cytosine(1402)-N(4))-methyltransferase RsmH, partial [bacterium]
NLNYIDIDKVSECEVDGIVFDLGLSLYQLFDGKRGFSFLRDSPLDMGMNGSSRSVRELINKMSEDEIADVIYKYGEERFSKKIASLIVKERQIKQIDTTGELVRIIKKAYPTGYKRIHPATRTFQALRIWANDELTNLENALSKAIKLLRVGGVLLIISYHSLEDRIVKRIFKEMEVCGRYKVITKKPIRPTREEVYLNRRARSAKLRGLRRIM